MEDKNVFVEEVETFSDNCTVNTGMEAMTANDRTEASSDIKDDNDDETNCDIKVSDYYKETNDNLRTESGNSCNNETDGSRCIICPDIEVHTTTDKCVHCNNDQDTAIKQTESKSNSNKIIANDADTTVKIKGDNDVKSTVETKLDHEVEDENIDVKHSVETKGDNDVEVTDEVTGGNEVETTEEFKGDNASCSEDSDSDGEYESAEEGEEIQVDTENLRDLEDTLTDEQKEERRETAQVLKEEGNDLFRSGSYKTAIKTYSRALRTCPLKFPKDRAIMYSNRGACKMRMEEYDASIRDCSKALELHPLYMKALMRRAELYEKTDKLDEALGDFQKILELDKSQYSARAACLRLPEQIKERNDKMKEEMMGKLKDLGNMVLRPFGLSTNNFKLNQDPNSGGYSVNFVQNPDQA